MSTPPIQPGNNQDRTDEINRILALHFEEPFIQNKIDENSSLAKKMSFAPGVILKPPVRQQKTEKQTDSPIKEKAEKHPAEGDSSTKKNR